MEPHLFSVPASSTITCVMAPCGGSEGYVRWPWWLWVWQESIIRWESVIRLPRSSRSHSLHQNTFHIMRRYNDYQELSKSLSLPLWLWWYNHKTINMNIEGKLFAPIFYLSKHSGWEKTKSSLTFVFPLDKRADKRSPLFNPFFDQM